MFADGEFAPSVLDEVDTAATRNVCVDGGLVHCLAAGLVPSLVVGDLDSVPEALLARAELAVLPRLVFPSDKDASDLELALHALADEGLPDGGVPDEVTVVGVSGGRTDHSLFNWLLPIRRRWPFRLRFVDDSVDALVVTPERPLSVSTETGRTVSLLPLERAVGVVTSGLRYALAGATLEPGATLGLSNVTSAQSLTVRLEEGLLLALRTRSEEGNAAGSDRAGRRGDRAIRPDRSVTDGEAAGTSTARGGHRSRIDGTGDG